MPLRILGAEGSAELQVDLGGGAPVQVRRDGERVRSPDGTQQPFLRLDPAPGSEGVRLFERLYAGPVWIEPRREGGLRVHAVLDLEEYVANVVAAEVVLWNAPKALLECQAIAARSYAVAQLTARAALGPRPVLFDSVLDQAHRGRFEPDRAAQNRGLDRRLKDAVDATRGRVLALGPRVLDARFHAACGGHTAHFADVFREADPGAMRAVPCPGCERDPKAWSVGLDLARLDRLFEERQLGRFRTLSAARTDAHGRWIEARLSGERGELLLPMQDLRRDLGWQEWRSARVLRLSPADGRRDPRGLTAEGVGHGHGVGLCQNGARHLAESGFDTRAILGHYYRGASLATLQ